MREEDDYWIVSAMKNDSVVAELLMRMNHSSSSSSEAQAQQQKKRKSPIVIEWGTRQPRSRQISRFSVTQMKKKGELNLASPTTPLSWSGGTSNSGGIGGTSNSGGIGGTSNSGGTGIGDGYEESSSRLFVRTNNFRSKVTPTSETAIRRSRKKKTFAELQDEQRFLMREKIDLNREFATLHRLHKEERAKNERLKRLKLHFSVQFANSQGISIDEASKKPRYDQYHQRETRTMDHTSTILQTSQNCIELDSLVCPLSLQEDSSKSEKEKTVRREMLPDLNLPVEEESSSETLYGMS